MSAPIAVRASRDQSSAWPALILALLSVPGSTLAWGLPAGGFWIGLPLAIAAIVLGLRARAEGSGRRMATAAVVVAGAMIVMTVIWTVAGLVS